MENNRDSSGLGFRGVERPDGLVYTNDDVAPELSWDPSTEPQAPTAPVREAPKRRERVTAQPWQPSPPPEEKAENVSALGGLARVVVMAAIPLALMFGLWRLFAAFAGMYDLG